MSMSVEKKSRRRSGRRRASVDSASASKSAGGPSTVGVISEEEKIEFGEGGEEELEFEASEVCFDGLFADLQRFKEENGNLTISISHPSFVSIMDKLSAVGIEELLRKRWESQLDSLKDFAKQHGDCLVPIEHPTLGEWVRVQHGHYKLFKKRLPSPLTKKRFTKLGEISGFDKLESSKEEQKDDYIAEKSSKSSMTSADSLALDKKIRMKKAANDVRLMSKGVKAFSPPSSSSKKLTDKESVAAEMQKKRAKGTAHRSAKAFHRSLVLKEIFSSEKLLSADEEKEAALNSSMPVTSMSGATEEHDEKLDSAIDPYEEKIRKKLLAEKSRSCSMPTNSGSTFEKSTGKKIRGEHDEILDSAADPFEDKLEKMRQKLSAKRNKMGGEVLNRSMNASTKDIKMRGSTGTRGTFEERLQRKLSGISVDETKQSGTSSATNYDDSLESLSQVETFDNTPASGSRSVHNTSGWKSRDDHEVNRFSRWTLVFNERDYGDKKAQSDCVSSVLNNMIYSDRWDLIPNENGDIRLEMTTQTMDEHKTVELYVEQLADRFSKSDFFIY